MDSLQNILGNKVFEDPDEITAIQDYVARRFHTNSSVRLQRDAIILSVPSSALAATLHLHRQQIVEKCNLTKKLVIRTGS